MIRFQHLSHAFDGVPVIQNFSLGIEKSEVLAFIGSNGCGKSTLMQMLVGRVIPQEGKISCDVPLTHKIGMVFQDYRQHLLPYRSARQNILFPLELTHIPKAVQDAKLADLLELIEAPFNLGAYPYTLSGGQAQLVSLLRALIIDPKLLILDEPFSALDYQTTIRLQTTMLKVVEHLKLTTLLISHNIEEAIMMADRLVILTPRPMRIHTILPINLPRPRNLNMIGTAPFAQLQKQAIQAFQTTVA